MPWNQSFIPLKQEGYTAYLNPSKDFVYDNIDLSKEAVIVKPLISESPLLDFKGVRTPHLEKILVDIYCDDDLDYLHGSEMEPDVRQRPFDVFRQPNRNAAICLAAQCQTGHRKGHRKLGNPQ